MKNKKYLTNEKNKKIIFKMAKYKRLNNQKRCKKDVFIIVAKMLPEKNKALKNQGL